MSNLSIKMFIKEKTRTASKLKTSAKYTKCSELPIGQLSVVK